MARKGSKAWCAEQAQKCYDDNFRKAVLRISESFNIESGDLKAAIMGKQNVTIQTRDCGELSFRFFDATSMFFIAHEGGKSSYRLEPDGHIFSLDVYCKEVTARHP